jgi:8-oxo-dGTP pyrophosphatase MutT (NUDIX family)
LSDVAIARPSSTVVLAREAAGAPELLLVRRHERSAFGGAHAFPGGVLEDSDSRVVDHCMGVTASEADALLKVGGGLAYFSAAARELFEESGVLLAAVRRRGSFVADNDVQLHCGALHYFSFWITPEALPKRFSTRFFLAAMPDDQEAAHCGGELTDSCWLSADEALAAHRDGAIMLHFPTIKTLQALAGRRTLDELLEWAASLAQEGVPCIFPEIEKHRGEARVIVAGRDSGALE